MTQLVKINYVPILAYFIVSVLILGQLFWPNSGLFYTPDFGLSDVWNYHYPMKELLAEGLKDNELPFWTKSIGTGMPIFAEGQVGALYLPNLLLFKIFPTIWGWNLSYIVTSLLAFWGSYWLFRRWGLSSWGAIAGSVIFSYGAGMVVHYTNPPMIAAISLMPWILGVTDRIFHHPKRMDLVLLSVLVSQQILAGYFQVVFITIVGLTVWYWSQLDTIQVKIRVVVIGLGVLFGIMLAAPQILPTWQLVKLSSRQLSPSDVLAFPMPCKHFLTMIQPYLFGDPRIGSYPPYSENWGIFWENTYFVSVTGLVLAGIALVGWRHKKKRQLVVGLVMAMILALGRFSPVIWVFSLPGFGFFRIQSRFMFWGVLMIAGLTAGGMDTLISKLKNMQYKVRLGLVVLSLIIYELVSFGVNYHVIVNAEEALKTPDYLKRIPKSGRVYTDYMQQVKWGEEFFNNGWKNKNIYLDLSAGMRANSNIVWGTTQIGYYGILIPSRTVGLLGEVNANVLAASGCEKYIRMEDGAGENESNIEFKAVDCGNKVDRIRFVSQYQVEPWEQALSLIRNGEVDLSKTVLLENDIQRNLVPDLKSNIQIVVDGDLDLEVATETNQDAILVVSDSYYPEWRAFVDEEETTIFPANGNQRAIFVAQGQHRIRFEYVANEFYKGMWISVGGMIMLWWLAGRKKWWNIIGK